MTPSQQIALLNALTTQGLRAEAQPDGTVIIAGEAEPMSRRPARTLGTSLQYRGFLGLSTRPDTPEQLAREAAAKERHDWNVAVMAKKAAKRARKARK